MIIDLKILRYAAGYPTAKEVALASGLSPDTVARIETTFLPVRPHTLRAYAFCINVTVPDALALRTGTPDGQSNVYEARVIILPAVIWKEIDARGVAPGATVSLAS